MKKVLLSAALMFTFALAQANENNTTKVESIKDDATISVKKETETKVVNGKLAVMPECFAGLSCGTFCDMAEDASDFWGQFGDIETIYWVLEGEVCGNWQY